MNILHKRLRPIHSKIHFYNIRTLKSKSTQSEFGSSFLRGQVLITERLDSHIRWNGNFILVGGE